MKKIFTYTLLAACILALSASCDQKIEPAGAGSGVDESAPISFSTGVVGTKGLIDNQYDDDGELTTSGLEVSGTTIQVYDYLTGLNGTFTGGTVGADNLSSGYYINNLLSYGANNTDGSSTNKKWQFPSNRKYYWTKTGTHKFFGWLTVDGNDATNLTAAKLFGNTLVFAEEDQTLALGPISMTPESTQFDFLYSDIVTRTTDHSAVPLNMKHLFTALSVAVNTLPDEGICPDCGYQMEQDEEGNWTCPECGYPDVNHEGAHVDPAEDVTIKVTSITITGLKTKRSATISFANDVSAVNIVDDAQAPSEAFTVTPSSAITLTEEEKPVMDYTLLWPQLPARTVDNVEIPADISDNATMSITYTLGEGDDAVEETSGPIKLKNLITQMDAGKKYQILITIRQSSDLRFVVTVEELENMNSSNEVFYFPS